MHTPVKELNEIRELLLSLNVKQWRISIVMPIGRAVENDLLLNGSQLRELFEFVKKNQTSINIILADNLPYLVEYEEQLRDYPIRCPVGITACCIGVTGHVRGCAEQPDTEQFREGNVRDNSILSIWQDGFKRYRLHEDVKNDPKCATCKVRKKCLGGCSVMREGGNQCIYDLLNR